VLEVRQLLTDPPLPGIPSTASQAFNDVTAYGNSVMNLFDGKIQSLLGDASGSAYNMATQFRSSDALFDNVADGVVSGQNVPPGTFGTTLRSNFGLSLNSFAGQVESLGSDFDQNSPRQTAVLPAAFNAGATISIPGFPGFSYSTPFYILGSDGNASVTQDSVSLTSHKTWQNPLLLLGGGGVDMYDQKVTWYDSLTAPGSLEGSVRREKSSPDGLASYSWDVKFRDTENGPLTLEGVFAQRDGAWIRSAGFKAVGDTVSLEDASLKYANGDTEIALSYHDHAAGEKYWQGHASRLSDSFGQTFKTVAGTQLFEDGDYSGYAASGIKLGESWGVIGVGIQQLDGLETQRIANVSFFLQHDLGPFGGIGASVSRNFDGPWQGTQPTFLNYFVPKDKPTLLFDVESLGNGIQSVIKIDLLQRNPSE
jgi:hypothetical protein